VSVPESIRTESLVLERIKFHMQAFIDEQMIDQSVISVSSWMDREMESIGIRFTAKIFGREVNQEIVDVMYEDVPTDWWQHFRMRWFPGWWIRRWPVVTRQIKTAETHRRVHVCPHLEGPKEKSHFTFLKFDGGLPWWGEGETDGNDGKVGR